MYGNFYHLSADAFRLIPDARFCFFHAGMAHANAYLEYALKTGDGFILVTGPPGTGKTTLIDTFISRLQRHSIIVETIAANRLEAMEVLRAVAYAYGIETADHDKVTLRQHIQQFFIQHLRQGRRGLLIIDEAQGLSHGAIEELRLLSDLHAGAQPLLQLFLVGQDSLSDVMCAPELEQFRQRVLGTCCLEPLDLQDTRGYVQHRLLRAGWKGDPEFTGDAIVAIHRHSMGVPRHINKLCTRLLLMGCIEGKHTFDAADVLTIAAELQKEKLSPVVSNAAGFADASQPVAKREEGTPSIAELALRADTERPEDHAGSARAVGQGVPPPAARSISPPSAARRAHSEVPAPASRVHPDLLAVFAAIRSGLGILWRRYGNPLHAMLVERYEVLVSEVRALVSRVHPHLLAAFAAIRSGSGILWRRYGNPPHARLVERYDVLVVVALSFAVMIPWLYSDAGDRNAAFEIQSETTGPLEQLSTLNLAPHPQEPAPAVIEPRQESAGILPAGRRPEVMVRAPPAESLPVVEVSALEFPAETTAAIFGQREPVPENPPVALAGSADPVSPHSMAESSAPVPEPAPAPEVVAYASQEATEPDAPLPATEPAGSPQPVVADVSVPAPAEVRQQKIDELLAQGQQALRENRLLIPAGNSAQRYFRDVLVLDPGNAIARDGMDQIVQRYVRFAEHSLARQDEEQTRRYIGRGLRVRPDDERLLALQGRLNTWLAQLEAEALQATPVSPPPALPVEPAAPPAAPPPSRPKGLFSRLKGFFSQSRRMDQADGLRE